MILSRSMRASALSLLSVLALAWPASAGEPEADVTKSYLHSPYHLSKYNKVFYSFNGRVWQYLPIEEKALYVEGLKAGMAMLVNVASPNGPNRDLFAAFESAVFGKLDSLELSRQIDVIFKDKSNLNIPIANAYILAGSRLTGKTGEREYNDLLAELRRAYTK